jgi:hypothetical protein
VGNGKSLVIAIAPLARSNLVCHWVDCFTSFAMSLQLGDIVRVVLSAVALVDKRMGRKDNLSP